VISRWERRDLEPTYSDLIAVAGTLAVTIDELLSRALAGPGRRRSRRTFTGESRGALGSALLTLRDHSGLDLYPVARASRIPPRRLRRIEAGAEPGLAELDRLLRAIGASPAELQTAANLDSPSGSTKVSAWTADRPRARAEPADPGDRPSHSYTISAVLGTYGIRAALRTAGSSHNPMLCH